MNKHIYILLLWHAIACACCTAFAQTREKYEFERNLPVYADRLIADLTYPMAWGNSGITDFEAWKNAARQKVLDCMLNPAPPASQFACEVLCEEQRNGYKALKIELTLTQYYTIPALLLIPEGKGPFPAINLLHDHGAHLFIGKEKMIRPLALESDTIKNDAQAWVNQLYDGQFWGDLLAQNGYVVLSADAPMWGDRGQKEGPRRDKYDMIAGNMMMYGIDLSAYMTYDDMSTTEWLTTLPEVDNRRIGCAGFSMGAYRSWMLAALSPHIKASASVCWMVTTDEQMSGHYKRTENGGFANCIPGLRRWLDYPHIASLACPKPAYFINGTQDKLFVVPGAEKAFAIMHEVWKSQQADSNLRTELWDIQHHCGKPVQESVMKFFKDNL